MERERVLEIKWVWPLESSSGMTLNVCILCWGGKAVDPWLGKGSQRELSTSLAHGVQLLCPTTEEQSHWLSHLMYPSHQSHAPSTMTWTVSSPFTAFHLTFSDLVSPCKMVFLHIAGWLQKTAYPSKALTKHRLMQRAISDQFLGTRKSNSFPWAP